MKELKDEECLKKIDEMTDKIILLFKENEVNLGVSIAVFSYMLMLLMSADLIDEKIMQNLCKASIEGAKKMKDSLEIK